MDKDGWQFVFPGLVKLISFQVNLHVHTENSVEQMHSGTYFSWSLYWVHLKTIWQDNHMFFGAEPWERWLCFSCSILSNYKRTGLDFSFHCTLHQANQGVMNCWPRIPPTLHISAAGMLSSFYSILFAEQHCWNIFMVFWGLSSNLGHILDLESIFLFPSSS